MSYMQVVHCYSCAYWVIVHETEQPVISEEEFVLRESSSHIHWPEKWVLLCQTSKAEAPSVLLSAFLPAKLDLFVGSNDSACMGKTLGEN